MRWNSALDEGREHRREGRGEQHRGRDRAGADELDVVVAADRRDQRPEAEPEREQVDRRLDGRGERRRAPVGGEVDDLAHEHAGQRRALERPRRRRGVGRHGARSASSPAPHARGSATHGSTRSGTSCDLLPGQQHEHVLEVRRPALARRARRRWPRPGAGPRSRCRCGACAGRPRARPPRPRRAGRRARRPRPPRARVLGDEVGGRAGGDRAAVRHDRHGVAEALGLLDVVRRHEDRDALGAQSRRSAPTAPGGPAGPGRRSARRAASSRGRCTSARAISSRRRMPPESSSTFVSRRSTSLAISSARSIASRRSPRATR